MTSKILFTALGLAALAVSPALAAKRPAHPASASGPYASAAAPAQIMEGRSVGSDPDANVRLELQRDWQTSQGAN